MKKLLISLLSLLMALGLCVGCGGGNTSSSVEQSSSESSSVEDSSIDETETRLEAAKAKLLETYEGDKATVGEQDTFSRTKKITLQGVDYSVVWSLAPSSSKYAKYVSVAEETNEYKVTINLPMEENGFTFSLLATITDKEQNKVEVTFNHTIPSSWVGPY